MDGAPLIGRQSELEAFTAALDRLGAGVAGVVSIEGEPGIGKSRLLGELASRAASGGCLVLGARASELELDLPYAVWTEALDRYLRDLGDLRLARLGLRDPGALAGVLAGVTGLASAAAADRHRVHRALRELVDALAAAHPLVVWFDDVQWLDPASAEALAALVHRPPRARVLLALAVREAQTPGPLGGALAGALRDGALLRLAPAPLDEAQAAQLVGPMAAVVYADSGGNPFYLEQLARAAGDRPRSAHLGGVPDRVAAALAAELEALPATPRALLDGAAVVGDPFAAQLAARVAQLSADDAAAALDALGARALIRADGVPGRFAFRHPVVRRAVYEATPAGRRLKAHARAAAALADAGAGVVARARHVEQAAGIGDEDALAVLDEAATELQASAPASSARVRTAALRLLPAGADDRRPRWRVALAEAQSAAGDPAAARATLLEALDSATPADHDALIVRIANTEYWLGRYEDARRRHQIALQSLPAEPSEDRIRLRLGLGLTALVDCDFAEATDQAADARDDAHAIGDPLLVASALALGAAAATALRPGDPAPADAAAAALIELADARIVSRLPALWMLARAQRALGRFGAALEALDRGARLARSTGRDPALLLLRAEAAAVLVERGRVAEASDAGEEAIELGRLLGGPPLLTWALCARSRALLLAGDVGGALRAAEDAADLDTPVGFHAPGQPEWARGAALVAGGNAAEGARLLAESLARVPPSERPAAAADLAEAHLAAGDLGTARADLQAIEPRNAWSSAVLDRATAQLLVADGEPGRAAERAAAAANAAGADAPLEAARARLVEGQALAALGDRARARATLTEAEMVFAALGAARWRRVAVRELRRLGHRVRQPPRPSSSDGDWPLTPREHELAELAADGRTNREIADHLVLSVKTVEAHLRNIFAKLGVRSRVELARAVERRTGADRE